MVSYTSHPRTPVSEQGGWVVPVSCFKASFRKEAELDEDAGRVGGNKVGNQPSPASGLFPFILLHLLFGASRTRDLKIAVRPFGNLYEGVTKAKPLGNV